MIRFAHIAVTALFALAIALPSAHMAYVKLAGVDLRSELEGDSISMPRLSPEGFLSGDAQDSIEDAVSGCVPFHDNLIIMHAAAQRALISPTAGLFGFNAYPTFYGSSHVHLADYDAVVNMPQKATEETGRKYGKAAKKYAAAFDEYDDVNCYFALVDSTATERSLAPYVSSRQDYAFFRDSFTSKLGDKCTVVDLEIGSDSNPFEYFFRTDHHWNISGAVLAYERICAAMGLDPIVFKDAFDATPPLFRGSLARMGVDTSVTPEPIMDVSYERSRLDVTASGKEVGEAFLDKGFGSEAYAPATPFEDMYNGYYHPYQAVMHLVNESVDSGTLLLVDDSYGHCMERFFAENYHDVYVIDRRGFQGTIKSFLEQRDVDDVLFLMYLDSATTKASIALLG